MKSFILSILVFVPLFFSACTEDIDDISTDSTSTRLVVEGYISTDTTRHKVRLSKLGDALNQEAVVVVSNASVTISDGTSEFVLKEDTTNKGTYYTESSVYGVPGKTYTLSIKNVDVNGDGVMEEYSATSVLKPSNPIDSIHVIYNNSNVNNKGWSVNLYAKDPGGGRNFYLMKVLRNDTLLTDSIFEYTVGDNTGFVGGYYDGFQVYYLYEDRADEKLVPGTKVTLEMYMIDENYYNFVSDYISDYYPKVPIFSGPSSNITTNILPKNSAVGIFAAYSVRRKSIIYP